MNDRNEFHYASTLIGTAFNILPAWGTAVASRKLKVRITDLKASCGGTARALKLAGKGGSYDPIQFTLAANSTHNFTWETGYPLEAVSSTGEGRGVYASAGGAGVQVVISGYVDQKN